jgi:hypothetical protein
MFFILVSSSVSFGNPKVMRSSLDNLVGHLFSIAKVSHEKRTLLNDIARSFVPLTMESWCEDIIV